MTMPLRIAKIIWKIMIDHHILRAAGISDQWIFVIHANWNPLIFG